MKLEQVRSNFLNEIEKLLSPVGFKRPSPDEFVLRVQHNIPGRTMVVNGSMYQEPATIVNMELHIYAMGSGWCQSGDKVEDFEQFSFKITSDQHTSQAEPRGTCIYYDDIEDFKSEILNLFNIQL